MPILGKFKAHPTSVQTQPTPTIQQKVPVAPQPKSVAKQPETSKTQPVGGNPAPQIILLLVLTFVFLGVIYAMSTRPTRVCGNGICESGETAINCLRDCSKQGTSDFVAEYNIERAKYTTLMSGENLILLRLNEQVASNDPAYWSTAQEYVDWADQNVSKMAAFQSWVEAHNNQLQSVGVNPDYLRDNIIRNIDRVQKNRLDQFNYLAKHNAGQ